MVHVEIVESLYLLNWTFFRWVDCPRDNDVNGNSAIIIVVVFGVYFLLNVLIIPKHCLLFCRLNT
jgi:hypothetical protein